MEYGFDEWVDIIGVASAVYFVIEALVTQYKSGNEKALNALLGKFLKSNKGYDPKEVKEELIKLLTDD